MAKINRAGMLRPLDDIRRYRKSWAVIASAADGTTVLTEQGELFYPNPGEETTKLLASLSDHVIYAQGVRQLLAVTDPTVWEVKQRRSRPIEAKHLVSGTRISFLPANILEKPSLEVVSTVAEYLKWLETRGVFTTNRGGWSTLGRHLFLSTLETPIRFFGPMACLRAPLYGGRKGCTNHAKARSVTKWDITGAYVSALAEMPMPRILEPSRNPRDSLLNAGTDGIAYAIVDVPNGRFPPLPQRADRHIVRHLRWPTGEINGWWTFNELRLARDYGSRISIPVAFEGKAYHSDFTVWGQVIDEGRDLPTAGKLAKYHGNVLWASFSVSPSTILYKRYDELRKPYVVRSTPPGGDFNRFTIYLSAIVASRIRERLHREALAPDGKENLRVVHFDTDGVISDHLRPPLGEHGDNLGQWREVRRMPLIEIRSASAYRYTCNNCNLYHPAWHYCVAGAKSIDAKKRGFDDEPSRRMGTRSWYTHPTAA